MLIWFSSVWRGNATLLSKGFIFFQKDNNQVFLWINKSCALQSRLILNYEIRSHIRDHNLWLKHGGHLAVINQQLPSLLWLRAVKERRYRFILCCTQYSNIYRVVHGKTDSFEQITVPLVLNIASFTCTEISVKFLQ